MDEDMIMAFSGKSQANPWFPASTAQKIQKNRSRSG
jgi:hypothetical protein